VQPIADLPKSNASIQRWLPRTAGALMAFLFIQGLDRFSQKLEGWGFPDYGWLLILVGISILLVRLHAPLFRSWFVSCCAITIYLMFVNPFLGCCIDNVSLYSFARSVQLELPDEVRNFHGRSTSSILITKIKANFEVPRASLEDFYGRNGFYGTFSLESCWTRVGSYDLDNPQDVAAMKQMEERFKVPATKFLKLCLSPERDGFVSVEASTSTN
jgi:hypothetical protein